MSTNTTPSSSHQDAAPPGSANSKHLHNLFASADKQEDVWVTSSKTIIGKLATPLLPQMGLVAARAEPIRLLDNASGPGVIVQEVFSLLSRKTLESSSVLSTDLSQGLVNVTKQRIGNESWVNTEARVLDAQDTKLPDNSFTHVTIGLGLHIMPNPDAAVKDAIRVLAPGGIFGATTFPEPGDRKFWFDDMKSAFASMPFDAPFPEKAPLQMHKSGRWYDPDWVREHLAALGLHDVEVTIRPGSYRVESADEYLRVFALMLSFMLSLAWTEEQRKAHSIDEIKGLVREHLVEKYQGKGWDIKWNVLYMTGRVAK